MARSDKSEHGLRRARSKRISAPRVDKQPAQFDRTNVWFLLDRSGSMGPLVDAVVDAFNEYLEDFREDHRPNRLTLALFPGSAEALEIVIDMERVVDIAPLTSNSFKVMGATPLYDAIAEVIAEADAWIEESQAYAEVQEHQTVIVFTDGDDTGSNTSVDVVRNLIRERQSQGWTFVFLGEGRVSKLGHRLGVEAENVASFKATNEGVGEAFEAIGRATLKQLAQDDPT